MNYYKKVCLVFATTANCVTLHADDGGCAAFLVLSSLEPNARG